MGSGLQHVSRDDPCRKGLCSRLGAACVIDEPFASSQFLEDLRRLKRVLVIHERRLTQDGSVKVIHLEVDVPRLSTGDSPFSFDDEDGDSTDTTLAGFLDLVFNRLDVLVRIEIGDGLVSTSQAPVET